MDLFLKSIAGVMITLVLYVVLKNQGKETAVVLSVAACCGVAVFAMEFARPVIDLFSELSVKGNLDQNLFQILLKATGIGILSEITVSVCADAGNAALGKMVQILSAFCIMWLSVPLFTSLISLLENLLENL